MKRLTALFLVFLITISMTACANNTENNESEENLISESVQENDTATASEIVNSESELEENSTDNEMSKATEMSTATQIVGDEQTGELPEIEGPDMFVELFLQNPIDAYYLDEIQMAASMSAMLNVTNNTMRYWEAEVNSVYSELMTILGEDSEEFKKIKLEQNAWSNDLTVATEEIKEEVQNTTTDGSMVNIEISYKLMLLYRGRAVELLCSAYNVTGEVDVQLITDAAG